MYDVSGGRFGMWTVLRQDRSRGRLEWLCRCDCGTERLIGGFRLVDPNGTRSCGCQARKDLIATLTKHGMADTPIHRVWSGMRKRCRDPKCAIWPYYGGRGITVCERWQTFANFYEDVGSSWAPGLTLERIDNDGNYEPGNVRWATRAEQARNRRSNVYIDTPAGRLTITDAATTFGIDRLVLRYRVKKGWPADQLFRAVAPTGRGARCSKSTSSGEVTPPEV